MKHLLAAIIAVAALWAGYWFWQSNLQKTAFELWFDDRRAVGWAADYSDLGVSGFPNRIDTTITEPFLGDPETGVMWSAPFFQILRLSYNPNHLILVWPHQQVLASPETEVQITSTEIQASLRMADLVNWVPERFIMAGQNVDLQADSGWQAAATEVQISAERMAAHNDSFRLALDARGVSGVIPDWIEMRSQEGQDPVLDRLLANVELTLDRPLNRSAIEAERPQITDLTLSLAEAEWSGLKLAMAGGLQVDTLGVPSGRLTLQVRNWRQMLTQEADARRLSVAAMGQIEFTLNLISGLSGNPETLDLPFDFKGGKIWLGPLVIGDAPNLRLR